MFKKIALAMTFLAVFSMAGLMLTNTAEAWRYWGRPYTTYYYGQPQTYYYGNYGYYGNYAPYRTYYRSYYSPRVYQPYTATYYSPGYYYGPIYR